MYNRMYSNIYKKIKKYDTIIIIKEQYIVLMQSDLLPNAEIYTQIGSIELA